jgi:hypothetical protein
MHRLRLVMALALAALGPAAPARADQVLPQGRILDAGPNAGDVVFGGLKLGKRQNGRLILTPDAITGDASGSNVTLRGVQRSLAVKLGELPTIQDFVDPTDNGDYAPAIERAAAKGVMDVRFPGTQAEYPLKRSFKLPNAGLYLHCDARRNVVLKLYGSDAYHGIVGNASTMSYGFGVENCSLARDAAASSGAVLKLQNVFYWDFNAIRIYGENKVWRGLELVSVGRGMSRDVTVDDVRERAVYASGGTAGGGAVGGPVVDNTFDYWYATNVNGVSSDPANDGVLYFEDNFSAQWIYNIKAARYKGFLIYFKGTKDNRKNNGLNLVVNPNAEATYSGAGVVRMDAVVSSQVGGSGAWISSYGLPAIRIGEDSLNTIVKGLQIGISGTGSDAVLDGGQYSTIQDLEAADYPVSGEAKSGAVVGIQSTAVGTKIERVSGNATLNLIRNEETSNNKGFIIRSADYYNIRGEVIPGLYGDGTNSIRDIVARGGQGPSNYFVAAATISVPYGKPMYFCYKRGTIDRMLSPGYLGEERVIQFQDSGTIRDINQSGVAGGAGGFMTKSRDVTNYATSATARFKWFAGYWNEM